MMKEGQPKHAELLSAFFAFRSRLRTLIDQQKGRFRSVALKEMKITEKAIDKAKEDETQQYRLLLQSFT